jgi:flagellar M-ring protein FliF
MPVNLLQQLKALHQKLSLNQKLSIAALGTVILFGTLSFVYLINKESYQLLFSDLDAAEARIVVERLEELGISYHTTDAGSSIAVPRHRINEARIKIASEVLPSSGRLGFEAFDENEWGITDFAQNVKYKVALSGELERTISGLSEVSSARVHLVMARESLFEEGSQPAKASVVVRLHSGRSLLQKQVKGIQKLVAYAVEGLDEAHVTVLDIQGNLLTNLDEETGALSDRQMEIRYRWERELVEKVIDILEPVLGPEKLKVTASVQLDYSETEQTEEIFDPESAVVRSHERAEETVGLNASQQGVPFRANDSDAPSGTPVQLGKDRRLQSELLNYEINRTVRQTRLPQGEISRLSVAVVVDDKTVVEIVEPRPDAESAGDEEQVAEDSEPQQVVKQVPRAEEEMNRLRELVSGAIGFDEARGDSLVITNVSFADVPTPEPPAQPGLIEQYQKLIQPVARYLLIFVLFGLFYLAIFRPVKKRVFSYVEVSDAELAGLEGGQVPQLGEGEEAAQLEEAEVPEKIDIEAMKKKKLAELAKEDPGLVTQIVRSWLSEGV